MHDGGLWGSELWHKLLLPWNCTQPSSYGVHDVLSHRQATHVMYLPVIKSDIVCTCFQLS